MLENSAKAILKQLLETFGYPVYTARYGLAKGLKVSGDLGFLQQGDWQDREESFLRHLHLRGKSVYDIGAHIGIMSMFFSCTVGTEGRVIAFEPNPDSYTKLCRNLALNGLKNVTTVPVGLGDKCETKLLVYAKCSRGAGSMDDAISAQLRKEKGSKALQIPVEVYTLDDYVKAHCLPLPDFVKIDVEGMEYNILRGMTQILHRYPPKLFIEMHGADETAKLENASRVIGFLSSLAYVIHHIESGQPVSANAPQAAREGHIYCTCAN